MTAAAASARLRGPLAFFGLVALLSTGALAGIEKITVPGSQECKDGPSFWCKNITNAVNCNAVKHCIQTTWVTQTYPEDNDCICSLCLTVFNDVRAVLTNNHTIDELETFIGQFCELLPDGIFRDECKELLNFVPTVVDVLASINSNKVCSLFGLCNNANIDKLLLEKEENEQPAVDSEHHLSKQCAIAMDKAKHLYIKPLAAVDEQPRKVQNVNVIKKSPVIDVFLKEMHFFDLPLTSNKNSKDSNDCGICISLTKVIESEISSKYLEGIIKTMLKSMCAKLPSESITHCKDFIETQYKSMVDRFVVQVKPEEICIFFDICKPNTISESAVNDLVNDLSLTSNKNSKDSNDCEICISFMKIMESELSSKFLEGIIKTMLKSMCAKLPSESITHCKDFVETQYKSMVDRFVVQVKPEKICIFLGICQPKTISESAVNDLVRGKQYFDLPTNAHLTITEPAGELDSSDGCAACEAFIAVFDKLLTNDIVTVEYIDLIELCNDVGIVHKDQCVKMIESSAQSFKNLLNQVPTWMMCERIEQCIKNKSVAVNQFSTSRCLEGSKYWCLSWDNAKECKAELLCSRS